MEPKTSRPKPHEYFEVDSPEISRVYTHTRVEAYRLAVVSVLSEEFHAIALSAVPSLIAEKGAK